MQKNNSVKSEMGGQVTVELLIILSVLLIILLISIHIFGTQTTAALNERTLLDLQANAEKIVGLVEQMHNSPIGTEAVVFIPTSSRDQNFQIFGSNVHGISGEYRVIRSLSTAPFASNSFSDGNFIRLQRTADEVSVTRVEAIADAGGGKGGGDDGEEGGGGDDS